MRSQDKTYQYIYKSSLAKIIKKKSEPSAVKLQPSMDKMDWKQQQLPRIS